MSKEPTSIDLVRHALGSINLSDIEDEKPMTEAERQEYCAAISAVFTRLEKDIKTYTHAQLVFSGLQAGNWEQLLVGRGTINGFDLLLDHWKKAHAEHMARATKPEPPDNSHSLPEL